MIDPDTTLLRKCSYDKKQTEQYLLEGGYLSFYDRELLGCLERNLRTGMSKRIQILQASVIEKRLAYPVKRPIAWMYDLAKYGTPIEVIFDNVTTSEEIAHGVYDVAFNIRPLYKENENE
jgi:hypothetical protein